MREKRLWGTLDPFLEGGAVLGRKVANAGFLDAFLAADPFDEYHFFLSDDTAAESLREALAERHPALYQRGAFQFPLRARLPDAVRARPYHCFHLSDFVGRHPAVSVIRNAYSPRIFPVTSVTHSLSYRDFTTAFLAHLWPGACARDAIVVTSHSGKAVVENAFAALREEYAIASEGPSLPLIPLGVDAGRARPPDSAVAAMRGRLGLPGEDELLFLCFSRISAQSKMDFLPLFSACKRAEKLGMQPGGYRLVLAGWAEEGDPLPDAFAALAASLGIRFSVIVRPTAMERDALYHMADIFLSPSDNIQETFGLTVIEAGAAGTPVIVSDFDGYKDTVIHEVTGLRVPVSGFGTSAETTVQASVWMDNQYHFKLAQETAVDVPAMAAAIARLALDRDLRLRMGEAARRHVAKRFDWPRVIEQYCELWDRMNGTPLDPDQETALRAARHPLRMDFARLFRGHFSRTVPGDIPCKGLLRRTALGDAFYRGVFPSLPYDGLDLMLDREALRRLLFLARKPVTAKTALAELAAYLGGAAGSPALPPAFVEERAAFLLLWALKQDLLEEEKS